MAAPSTTPEVEPITSLIAHPLLQDPKFLVAVVAVVIGVVVFSGQFGETLCAIQLTV